MAGRMLVILAMLAMSQRVEGYKLSFERRAPGLRGAAFDNLGSPLTKWMASGTSLESVGSVADIRYTANITINGVVVHVVLDTGSTDLWVLPPPPGIGTFNDTGIPLALYYGDRTFSVSGKIGVSPFQFGEYAVERQAFLSADESTIPGLQESGIHGVLGLGFELDRISPLNQKIRERYGQDATWGQSVLANIFQQNPTAPNFVALDLARTGDLEDTNGGSLFIGEYEPAYASVANAPKLVQYPKDSGRWTTLLEGITVDNVDIEIGRSIIRGVPSGNLVALLDTGDPTAVFPYEVVDAIYSHIPGSKIFTEDGESVWLVPCNTTAIVSLKLGGLSYPIHPLDLTQLTEGIPIGNKTYTACIQAIKGARGNWAGDFDVSLGDAFLRNVYSVFDFGDTVTGSAGTTAPYIQLLSQIDIAKAKAQVQTIRGETLKGLPSTVDPEDLMVLLDTPTRPSSAERITEAKNAITLSSGDHTITISEETFKKYAIWVLVFLAANTLIGMALIAFAVLSCIRRGSSKRTAMQRNLMAPQYAAVKTKDADEGYGGYNTPYDR